VKGVPDGQLFWIDRNGSPGTAMSPANALGKFTDENIWQLVAYLRTFPR
jgi:mono/diheme cytochrome c family protein